MSNHLVHFVFGCAVVVLGAAVAPGQELKLREVRRISNPYDILRGLAISPDGKQIIAGASFRYTSGKGDLMAWSQATGKELYQVEFPTLGPFDMTFTPDGKRIVVGLMDQTVRVMDAETRKELLVLKGHEQTVSCVAVSADGKYIASGSTHHIGRDAYDKMAKGHLRLWDAATGKQLWASDVYSGVGSVSISPDGKRIATGNGSSFESRIMVWELETGKELHTAACDKSDFLRAAYSPDGKYLAGTFFDKAWGVVLWDAKTMKPVRTIDAGVGRIAFSPDGKRLAGTVKGGIRVWDTETGREVAACDRTEAVSRVAFSPNGDWIAQSDEKGQVTVWSLGK